MKPAAFILFLIWSLLLLEPLSANMDIVSNYSSCAEEEEVRTACCTSTCEKPVEEKEEDECAGNRCNPLLSCPIGNFYLSGYTQLTIPPYVAEKVKTFLVNDNRIVKQHADCWHPPEIS